AEQLAEAAEPLVEQGLDRLEGRVTRGDAGATGEDEYLQILVGAALADDRRHLGGLVLDDGVSDDRVAGPGQRLADERAARVGLRRLGIRDGEHEAADRARR